MRRLEGVALHPALDADGVNRFHPAEVERVAARTSDSRNNGRHDRFPARSRWFESEVEQRGEDDDESEDTDAETDDDTWDAERSDLDRELREREVELETRELALREREATHQVGEAAVADAGAEALRADREFRTALRARVAALVDDLDRLPAHVVARLVDDDDAAFLAAVIRMRVE